MKPWLFPTRPRISHRPFLSVLRVTSGNFLEMYDFMVFGYYATYIAKTFFPANSEFDSLMLAFATFGSGFFMRPTSVQQGSLAYSTATALFGGFTPLSAHT